MASELDIASRLDLPPAKAAIAHLKTAPVAVAQMETRHEREGVQALEESMKGLSGEDLITAIREFSEAHIFYWQRIPVIALEAEERVGVYDPRLEHAYRDGIWPVLRVPDSIRYCAFVDLLTGELLGFDTSDQDEVEPVIPQYIPGRGMKNQLVPLDSNMVRLIAPHLEVLRAIDVVEELTDLTTMPYPREVEIGWKAAIADSLRQAHLAA